MVVTPASKVDPSELTPDAALRLPATPSIAIPSAEYLRFDDLRTRCTHPHWNPDPNVNVFLNPALSPHGAEQFRTLRSRLYQLRSNQTLRTVLITSPSGGGEDFCYEQLSAGDRSPAGSPGAHY